MLTALAEQGHGIEVIVEHGTTDAPSSSASPADPPSQARPWAVPESLTPTEARALIALDELNRPHPRRESAEGFWHYDLTEPALESLLRAVAHGHEVEEVMLMLWKERGMHCMDKGFDPHLHDIETPDGGDD